MSLPARCSQICSHAKTTGLQRINGPLPNLQLVHTADERKLGTFDPQTFLRSIGKGLPIGAAVVAEDGSITVREPASL